MYAARIEIGWFDRWYKGETVNDIMSELYRVQNFECLINMGRNEEKKVGQKQLDKLEAFLNLFYSGELTIDDLKNLDVKLSIGNIKCHEIVEGEEAVNKVMEK